MSISDPYHDLKTQGEGSSAAAAAVFRGPCCVATWSFGAIAVDAARRGLAMGRSAVASIEAGRCTD